MKIDERRKLPVWPTVAAAYGCVWDPRGDFLRLAPIPLAAAVAIDLAVYFIWGVNAYANDRPVSDAGQVAYWVSSLLLIAVWVPLYVAWSRLLLLAEVNPNPVISLQVGRAEMRYLLLSLALMLTTAVVLMAVVLAYAHGAEAYAAWAGGEVVLPPRYAVVVVTGLCVALVAARFVLTFAGITVGARLSLISSWRLTRGSGLRITATFVFATVPYLVLRSVFDFSEMSGAGAQAYAAAVIVDNIFGWIIGALTVAAAALAFCAFTGWPRTELIEAESRRGRRRPANRLGAG